MKIAIIGGGITGLSALHEIEKQRAESGRQVEVNLYEKGAALGGKISTLHRDGFTIERGPDSFITRKPEMLSLVEELGLSDRLVKNHTGQAYIASNGEFHPIPEGSVMGIPTRAVPFLRSPLLTKKGKMRAAADLWLPAKKEKDTDESLGLFFRRRFGDELVDRLLEPLLSGLYAGELNELSLEATFPQFRQMGVKHRSLIQASRSMAKKRQQSTGTGQKTGLFRTVKGGLSVIVDEMEKAASKGTIHREKQLQEIIPGEEKGYTLYFADGTKTEADEVILTVPHQAVADVLPSLSVGAEMKSLPGASVATVAIAFPALSLREPVNGTGFLIPKGEGDNGVLKAVTLVHHKWPHLVPDGNVLLRCFVGRPGNDAIVRDPDETVIAQTLNELRKFLDIQGEPLFADVTRWKSAMPKYTVGHQSRVDTWESALADEYPGVHIAGTFYRGVGLPDCVRQGRDVASHVLSHSTSSF
ncbi:protoporphyrinogen oxidase [Salicibibacter cibarius]|uniref:Coproporphyrinogen III oxidase n=1 Tax=Salicibibacter cibarius TaxID=2743000 RepID=A0A7T6Z3C5_9BACI|nr:protoporphyrinogen oxidase [Salicibibacter cibarius]QQK75641.1 protoporphyrinogen oxidase [Salicibibacter cibarius]